MASRICRWLVSSLNSIGPSPRLIRFHYALASPFRALETAMSVRKDRPRWSDLPSRVRREIEELVGDWPHARLGAPFIDLPMLLTTPSPHRPADPGPLTRPRP